MTSTHGPVGVAGHVFIDALDSYLQPGASVAQHVTEVPLQAVVGPRLDSDPHAFGITALRVPAGEKHPQLLVLMSFLLIGCF